MASDASPHETRQPIPLLLVRPVVELVPSRYLKLAYALHSNRRTVPKVWTIMSSLSAESPTGLFSITSLPYIFGALLAFVSTALHR
jgi:hypothetical protein